MKTTTLSLAAALALTAASSQAEGITFNKPVTYTQAVTYSAGVTYLAPVTYGEPALASNVQAEPVRLERIIVTPRRSYSEREWRARQQQLAHTRAERRALQNPVSRVQALIHAAFKSFLKPSL